MHVFCCAQVSCQYDVKWEIKHLKIVSKSRTFSLTIQNQYFISLDGIYCKNDYKKYATCNQCPKSNDTLSSTWCSGDCDYDEANNICRESNYHILEKWYFRIKWY